MYQRPLLALKLAASIANDLGTETGFGSMLDQCFSTHHKGHYPFDDIYWFIALVSDGICRRMLKEFPNEDAFFAHWNTTLDGGFFLLRCVAAVLYVMQQQADDPLSAHVDSQAVAGDIADRVWKWLAHREPLTTPAPMNQIAAILGVHK
jgi:hypothetical protein